MEAQSASSISLPFEYMHYVLFMTCIPVSCTWIFPHRNLRAKRLYDVNIDQSAGSMVLQFPS